MYLSFRAGILNPFRIFRAIPSNSGPDLKFIEHHLSDIERIMVIAENGSEVSLSVDEQEKIKDVLLHLGPYRGSSYSMTFRDVLAFYIKGNSKPAQVWVTGCSPKDQSKIKAIVGNKMGPIEGTQADEK